MIRPIETIEELRQLFEIDAAAYEECSITFEAFSRWWQRYPLGNTVVWDSERVIASMGIWALSSDQYEAFAQGEIREEELVPLSIGECEAEPQKYWYFSGIVVIPELRRKRSSPLKRLLKEALTQWSRRIHLGYPVLCCALCYSDEGRSILKRLAFVKTRSGEEMPDECSLYEVAYESQRDVEQIFRLW